MEGMTYIRGLVPHYFQKSIMEWRTQEPEIALENFWYLSTQKVSFPDFLLWKSTIQSDDASLSPRSSSGLTWLTLSIPSYFYLIWNSKMLLCLNTVAHHISSPHMISLLHHHYFMPHLSKHVNMTLYDQFNSTYLWIPSYIYITLLGLSV